MLIPFGVLSAAGAFVPVPRVGVAGYFGGGQDTNPTILATVDKYAFPAETRSTLGTGLSTAVAGVTGFSDSGVAGYFAGGRTAAARVTTVNKFAFPADTRTTLGTGLSSARQLTAGFYNWGVGGYVAGGTGSTNQTNGVSTVNKFAFPADTQSTLGTGLSIARTGSAGASNQTVAGYVAGGWDNINPSLLSSVDKYALPADTRSTLGTGLEATRAYLAGVSNNEVAGYFCGGETTSTNRVSTIRKCAFPSDTMSTLGTTLSVTMKFLAGNSNDNVAGYIGGGKTSNAGSLGGETATVNRFDFSAETNSTLGTGLSVARAELGGMSNEG
jgi:hypothetical protein